MLDTNDLFPYLRVCTDDGFLQQVIDEANGRLEKLQTSRLGSKAVAAGRANVRVQPTDETSAGGASVQPLTGPSPGMNLRQDIFAMAEANQRREDAQIDSLRGPGPAIASVSVGPVSDGEKQEAKAIKEETRQQTVLAAQKTAGQNQQQQTAEKPLVVQNPAGAAPQQLLPRTQVAPQSMRGPSVVNPSVPVQHVASQPVARTAAVKGTPPGANQGTKSAAATGHEAGVGTHGAGAK